MIWEILVKTLTCLLMSPMLRILCEINVFISSEWSKITPRLVINDDDLMDVPAKVKVNGSGLLVLF